MRITAILDFVCIFRLQVAVGKYDGKHPSLTFATTGGKAIIIHFRFTDPN